MPLWQPSLFTTSFILLYLLILNHFSCLVNLGSVRFGLCLEKPTIYMCVFGKTNYIYIYICMCVRVCARKISPYFLGLVF